MNVKYFSLERNTKQKTASLNIFGDITSYPWNESDVSMSNLSKQLEAMNDVEQIDVYINSYGGEVAEGLAIYNALKRHKATIVTHCEGFACSIASVIFMAGDERIMNEASLLMIHNAWTIAEGNAQELRKQADDLEKITKASLEIYKSHSSLSEEEITALMDAETWILPDEAIEYGFATAIGIPVAKAANQSALHKLFDIIKAYQSAQAVSDDEPEEEPIDDEEDSGNEPQEPTDDDSDTPEEEPDNTDDDSQDNEPESEDSDDENMKKAAQKWSGFFNTILKL